MKTENNNSLQFNMKAMAKEPRQEDVDKGELTFKITTKVEATNKTPDMIYLSASNNLVRWGSVKKELIELRCEIEELQDAIIFAEHGFWIVKDKLNKLVNKSKIKVEMQ